MRREYTFYEVFDLNERATAQQVRSAYLRLMKLHHPDRSVGQQTPGFVALINLCYETLSDPVKRAAYDSELRQRNSANAALSPVVSSARGRVQRSRLAAAALLVVASAAVIALVSAKSLTQTPPVLWAGTVAAEPARLPRLTQRDLIERQVRLAKTLSPAEALLFSERCFRQAQAERSGRPVQLCIIFDDAFLYWRQTPQWNAMLPPYFDDDVVRARHTGALLRFETNVEGTLAQLRYEAFRALLDGVHTAEAATMDPT